MLAKAGVRGQTEQVATSDGARCTERLDTICRRLAEVSQRPGGEGGRHIAYMVKTKTFAYFTDDHHGNGRLALTVKAPPGEQTALITGEPGRFFVPPYLGHRGWVGMWLDRGDVDWDEIEELMIEAYRLTAPRRLAALLE